MPLASRIIDTPDTLRLMQAILASVSLQRGVDAPDVFGFRFLPFTAQQGAAMGAFPLKKLLVIFLVSNLARRRSMGIVAASPRWKQWVMTPAGIPISRHQRVLPRHVVAVETRDS